MAWVKQEVSEFSMLSIPRSIAMLSAMCQNAELGPEILSCPLKNYSKSCSLWTGKLLARFHAF